jgi:hypothetical protein
MIARRSTTFKSSSGRARSQAIALATRLNNLDNTVDGVLYDVPGVK